MSASPSLPQIPHAFPYIASSWWRMFHILAYSPRMGRSGTTVTVDLFFECDIWNYGVLFRIVIGSKPVHTVVKYIGDSVPSLWRCTGAVPEFEVHKYSRTHTVNVTLQAVDKERNIVLDTVTFGYFTYRESGLYPSTPLNPSVLHARHGENVHLHSTQSPTAHSVLLDRRVQNSTSPAPPLSQASKLTPSKFKRVLRRYANNDNFEEVSLDLAGDLTSLGKTLTEKEMGLRRRLVRFTRKEDGNTLRLSFHPIRQEEYEEGHFIISCICLQDTRDTWLSSVDMMKLFEYITQEELSDNEKGRIRRNLEFLHPITVSRTARSHIFQLLMHFPIPKPRTIEKSIKIFKWSSLEAGLNKVFDKYCWVTVPMSEDAPSSRRTKSRPTKSRRAKSQRPVNDDTSQDPTSYDPFAATLDSFDGANTPEPDCSRPPSVVPATHVNPSWLYSQDQDVLIGPPTANPFTWGDMSPPSPRAYVHSAEVSHNTQTLTYYESFHHFDSLETQTLHEHSAHSGMVSPCL